MKRSWNELRTLHDRAVADYAAAAHAVPAAIWTTPQGAGKWSPAQITQHLILAFEAALLDVREGVPMQLRTTGWQRVLLRFTIQRRLMRGGRFPHGARSPRESRPADVTEDAATLVRRFQEAAGEVTRQLEETRRTTPAFRLTHPYFGRIPPDDALYISARHIDHHRAQLPTG